LIVQFVEDALHIGQIAAVSFFQGLQDLLGFPGVGAGGGKCRYGLFLPGNVGLILLCPALGCFEIYEQGCTFHPANLGRIEN
jgi:hypothetical protein